MVNKTPISDIFGDTYTPRHAIQLGSDRARYWMNTTVLDSVISRSTYHENRSTSQNESQVPVISNSFRNISKVDAVVGVGFAWQNENQFERRWRGKSDRPLANSKAYVTPDRKADLETCQDRL